MHSCPKCKGRATKIVNASTGTIGCQQCGHEYKIVEPTQAPHDAFESHNEPRAHRRPRHDSEV